jgi:hypothetical protein
MFYIKDGAGNQVNTPVIHNRYETSTTFNIIITVEHFKT